MANYGLLDRLFSDQNGFEVEYSFEEIEEAIGEKLPVSAHVYMSWWRGSRNAPWRAYGWKAHPNLRSRTVHFTRAKQVPQPEEEDARSNKTESEVFTSRRRLILVGGVSGKKDKALPAKDLYDSSLWEKRRTYAEATGSPWMIISSEYGVLHPDTVIEPYNADFTSESAAYRRAWSERVAAEIIDLCRVHELDTVEAHAGSDQLLNGLVEHLNAAGLTVSWPLKGRRIGEQLSWYTLAVGAFQSLPKAAEEEPADEQDHTGMPAANNGGRSIPESSSESLEVEDDDVEAEKGPPRLIVLVASMLNRIRRAYRWLGGAFKRWGALLAVEMSRRDDSREEEAGETLSLRRRVKLAERIAHFGETRSQIIGALDKTPWTGDLDADEFLRANGFAFLVGVIMDQGGVDDGVWGAPYMLSERLGHLDPEKILEAPVEFGEAVLGPPALHRQPEKVSGWILRAAQEVVDQYEGDARHIWDDEQTREDVRRQLEKFDGIGPRQSARAVELLQRRIGVRLTSKNRGPMAYEADLRRVMLRSGLAEFDDIEHMTMSMSDLYPDDPGSLDLALLAIGNLWCHPVDPNCRACAIGQECPRFIEPSGGTPQLADESDGAGPDDSVELSSETLSA